jgi:thymidylate synthase
MHCMWRSRDLFTAWNSNYVGLLTMVKKEILEPNNLRLIKVVDFCNSLHIYKADWESAATIKRIAVNPQLRGKLL